MEVVPDKTAYVIITYTKRHIIFTQYDHITCTIISIYTM